MMIEFLFLRRAFSILNKVFIFLLLVHPFKIYADESGVLLGLRASLISSLLPDATGDDAYYIAKQLKADLSRGYPGPYTMPGLSLSQGYISKNGFNINLMEEYFITEVDARFSGEYLLDPDFYYRRNFFNFVLSPGYKKDFSIFALYMNAGGGISYIITHTKGYFNNTYYRVGRPILSAKIGFMLPDDEPVHFDIGLRYSYLLGLPSTNFFYNDGGNASLVSFEVGVLFSI